MKKLVTVCLAAAFIFAAGAYAEEVCPDSLLEQVLLLQFAEKAGIDDYDLIEVLEGYRAYRSAMDAYTKQRAAKEAALKAAIANDDSDNVVSGLTRELMALDLSILRLKQSTMDEAADIMSAAEVAELYLMVSNFDAVKAELAGKLAASQCTAAPCPIAAACPAAADCPIAAACPDAKPASAAAPAAAPSGPEAILARATEFLNKLFAGNLDAALEGVSEDFQNSEYADKAELKDFLESAIAMGFLEDASIDLEDTEVTIEGDTATVYPLDISGNFGSGTLEFVLKNENGKWVLVGFDAFGI